MLNMGLLVCCSLPYVIISTPIIYSTVKTWFAASHNSAGSRTDRYRGKYAKLSTCNRELTYRDAHGNSFRFDGDELVCDKYRIGGFMPFSSSGYAQMRIPVTDDMQVKITDSNQVTDQTVLM